MKKPFLIFLFAALFSSLIAQDCNPFFAYSKGQTFELTSYDKKDKLLSVASYEVIDIKAISDNKVEALFTTTVSDKKGKEVTSGEYSVFCEDGIYKIDVESMINNEFLENYKNMEVTVEGTPFDLPSNLNEGQKLDDLEAKVNIGSSGSSLLNMTVSFTDRVVDGFEKVSTPAGEFDCVVLSYVSESKLGFIKSKIYTTEYYAKGVGVVKSVHKNKKGKLKSYSQLTSLSK